MHGALHQLQSQSSHNTCDYISSGMTHVCRFSETIGPIQEAAPDNIQPDNRDDTQTMYVSKLFVTGIWLKREKTLAEGADTTACLCALDKQLRPSNSPCHTSCCQLYVLIGNCNKCR